MQRHPYTPANKRGMVLRITTTEQSVPLPNVDRGPCTFVQQGVRCGLPERVNMHREPYYMVGRVKEIDEEASRRKGVGDDTPIL